MARDGLSHAVPNATTERVLQAALRLLLEKQAKARGQVRRPRTEISATPTETLTGVATPATQTTAARTATERPAATESTPHRRAGPRETIPAAVRRTVWERDGGRCAWPLDGGGCCGSTHRLEFDHVVPWARFGDSTVANLRLTCSHHNQLASRQVFGAHGVERYAGAPWRVLRRHPAGGAPAPLPAQDEGDHQHELHQHFE
jgi:5-methylcytosine-specific restriction endonuclease McrA